MPSKSDRPLRLLILEDDPLDLELVVQRLTLAGFELEYTHVETETEYLDALDPRLDLILSDYNLPDFDGMRALGLLKESGLDIPFILTSGKIGEEQAVEAIKEGASDYLLKDRLGRLGPAISNAIEQKRLRDEKRRTDEALRESNEFNERLLQTVPSPMDIVDEDGRILYMNPAMEQAIGQQVLGERYWEIYKDDRQQCADCPLKRDIEVGVTRTLEGSGMLGGRAFEVSYTGMSFGGQKAILKVYHDITERKQAREALASERNLLRTLIDHLPDSIYAKDINGRFTLKNLEGALMMGGASPDEVLGKTDFDYYPPEIAAKYHEDDQAVIRSGQAIINNEERFVDGSGRTGWAATTKVPLRDEQGNIVGLVGVGRDITEEKEAAEALRESERKLREAQQLAQLGYWYWDINADTVEWSDEVYNIFRLDPAEFTPQVDSILALSAPWPEDRQLDRNLVQWATESHESGTYEQRFLRPDGSTGHYFSTYQGIYDDQGELIAIRGTIQDITERKLAAERLQTQLRRLGALHEIDIAISGNLDLQTTLDLVVEQTTKYLDVDAAVILLLNPHTQRLTSGAHIGMHTNAVEATNIHLDEAFIWPVVQEGRIVQIDDPAQVEADSVFTSFWDDEGFVAYSGVPLIVKEHVIGVLEVYHRTPFAATKEWRDFLETLASQAAIAVDNARLFEETRRLLQQTQIQAQQLQQIMETVPAGIVLMDSDFRVLNLNASARKHLTLLTSSEIDENPEDSDVQLTHLGEEPITTLLSPPPPDTPFHEVAITQSKQEYIFGMLLRPVTALADCDQWVLLLLDLTQERKMEASIQQHERLAAVGQLASGIAHDFNNLISTITLLAQMIPRTQELSATNQKRVDSLIEQAHHAVNLIRQLLDFSRSSVIERSTVDLLPVLKETVKLLERTLPGTIRLELDAEPGEYIVEADLSRLQQVFLNLAVNARDAMPEGGNLRIGLERMEVRAGQEPVPDMAPGTWLCLSVADNGSGISPENVSRIFDPFFTTKEPGSGTGLGLSQVYGIIKQHDGEVTVTSQVGKGTIFTLYLPAAISSVQTELVPVPQPSAQGKGERILVVEDEELLRQAIQEILENSGYQVFAAENGLQALDLLEQQDQDMDLVMSDMSMPEMGGMELMRILRKLQPELKMILMTGYPLQDEDKEQLEKQVVQWVQKPFFGTKLEDTVQAMLKTGSPS